MEAERVLSGAFGTRGFAFLLPTMATSDQMYGRITQALGRQSGQEAGLTLVHSMAWLNTAYSDELLDAGQQVVTCDGDEAGAERQRAEADKCPRPWLRPLSVCCCAARLSHRKGGQPGLSQRP